jgi:mycothiol system anti-sigma-R factor
MLKCEEVLKHLYEYIDKQLEGVSYAEIEEHLKLCKYCCAHHDFEIELRKMVVKSCFQKKAPEFLKGKISSMLAEYDMES